MTIETNYFASTRMLCWMLDKQTLEHPDRIVWLLQTQVFHILPRNPSYIDYNCNKPSGDSCWMFLEEKQALFGDSRCWRLLFRVLCCRHTTRRLFFSLLLLFLEILRLSFSMDLQYMLICLYRFWIISHNSWRLYFFFKWWRNMSAYWLANCFHRL